MLFVLCLVNSRHAVAASLNNNSNSKRVLIPRVMVDEPTLCHDKSFWRVRVRRAMCPYFQGSQIPLFGSKDVCRECSLSVVNPTLQ